jgi:hypothetical integral membrane protein (TIGR02206 family)
MPVWLQHYGCVIAFIAVSGMVILRTRRLRDPADVRSIELIIVALGLIASVIVNWWWLRPANFVIQESLPLQLCDLAGIIAPFALLTHARWLRTLLHFWGLGLSSQWMFTTVAEAPDGSVAGPAHVEYWISFILHTSIIGSGWFDYFVGGFRPRWRDCFFAIGAGVVYLFAMLALNAAIGSNYAFVGNSTPGAPTIVDVLGPWPLRIVWIALLATTALVVVQLINVAINRLWPDMKPSVLSPQS